MLVYEMDNTDDYEKFVLELGLDYEAQNHSLRQAAIANSQVLFFFLSLFFPFF